MLFLENKKHKTKITTQYANNEDALEALGRAVRQAIHLLAGAMRNPERVSQNPSGGQK